jgi:hypothetical protein
MTRLSAKLYGLLRIGSVLLLAAFACSACVAAADPPQPRIKRMELRDGYQLASGYYAEEGAFVLHGTVRSYRSDGTLFIEACYAHGEQNGSWRRWDFAGRLVEHNLYSNGQLSGLSIQWHFPGETTSYSWYVGGVKEGPSWTTGFDNEVLGSSTYVGGQLHGSVYYVDRVSGVRVVELYEHGKLIERPRLDVPGIGRDK